MHLVSIDWLSIYVDCSHMVQSAPFNFVREPYGTSVYADMYTIMLYDKEIAILTCNPRSTALVKGTGILKILNPILYHQGLAEITYHLLDACRIEFKNISRLDICADFNRFEAYPDMQDFFQDFLTLKILKIGAAKYKVCANATTSQKYEYFKMIGQQSSRHTYQYLRFGSKVSKVSAYLYNKTQEFRDVKRKNYIADAWEANGIDESKEVWRLEFSLKGDAIKFLNTETGEWQAKNLEMVFDPTQRAHIYDALYCKYWCFRVNDGQVRKDRMTTCRLLSIEAAVLMPVVLNDSDITDREQKRMISAVERTYDEVRFKRQTRDMEIEHSIEKLVDFTRLRAWHAEKFGKKYADMDFAEQAQKEDAEREMARLQPSLFDNQ